MTGLRLGFNARIAFPTGGAARGLEEGIDLFRAAEELGYDTGWVYQRHFDNYLAAPLVFLAAVAQRTERIALGTAIIGIRYEDPILLAEAAATLDLLSAERLRLGLGTGQGGYDAAFGQAASDGRRVAQDRLERFLVAVRGDRLGVVEDPAGLVPPGTPLHVRPTSTSLPGRIAFGAGSQASAVRVGERGLRLLLSTILHGDVEDFGAELARIIGAYREAHAGPGDPHVAVARSVLPATSPGSARSYAAYDAERRALGPGASRPDGALPTAASLPVSFTASPVHHGDPDTVAEQLLDDPSVPLADELICFIPPAFGLRESLRLLEDVATTVAPQLGWRPDGRRSAASPSQGARP